MKDIGAIIIVLFVFALTTMIVTEVNSHPPLDQISVQEDADGGDFLLPFATSGQQSRQRRQIRHQACSRCSCNRCRRCQCQSNGRCC